MPKIDLDAVELTNNTIYPPPFAATLAKRYVRRLGAVAGLSDFGVTQVVLQPGGISSQRHWHEEEDEFVVILEGEAVLIEEDCETVMRAGECATFPKKVANGHHFVNRSQRDCIFIAVGRALASECHYPDIDMRYDAASRSFTRKDGTPYDG